MDEANPRELLPALHNFGEVTECFHKANQSVKKFLADTFSAMSQPWIVDSATFFWNSKSTFTKCVGYCRMDHSDTMLLKDTHIDVPRMNFMLKTLPAEFYV